MAHDAVVVLIDRNIVDRALRSQRVLCARRVRHGVVLFNIEEFAQLDRIRTVARSVDVGCGIGVPHARTGNRSILDLTGGNEILPALCRQLIADLKRVDDLHRTHLVDIGSVGRIDRRDGRRAGGRRARHLLPRRRHPPVTRGRVYVPCIALTRIVAAGRIAVERVPAEEIHP